VDAFAAVAASVCEALLVDVCPQADSAGTASMVRTDTS
jgi:hypothetical protein